MKQTTLQATTGVLVLCCLANTTHLVCTMFCSRQGETSGGVADGGEGGGQGEGQEQGAQGQMAACLPEHGSADIYILLCIRIIPVPGTCIPGTYTWYMCFLLLSIAIRALSCHHELSYGCRFVSQQQQQQQQIHTW